MYEGDESRRLIVHSFFFQLDITIEKRADARFSHLPAEFGFHVRANNSIQSSVI